MSELRIATTGSWKNTSRMRGPMPPRDAAKT